MGSNERDELISRLIDNPDSRFDLALFSRLYPIIRDMLSTYPIVEKPLNFKEWLLSGIYISIAAVIALVVVDIIFLVLVK